VFRALHAYEYMRDDLYLNYVNGVNKVNYVNDVNGVNKVNYMHCVGYVLYVNVSGDEYMVIFYK